MTGSMIMLGWGLIINSKQKYRFPPHMAYLSLLSRYREEEVRIFCIVSDLYR